MRTTHLSILLTIAFVIISAAPCPAQWLENGNPVASTPEYQAYSRCCSDGTGGIIAVWQDQRLSSHSDIFAQRMDNHGRPLWTVDGVLVCDETSIQSQPRIAPDGQGGAVLVWTDQRNGGLEIFAQRVDADGNSVWATDGVRVFSYTYGVGSHDITGDGFGGALITWHDNHADLSTHRVYAQRLAAVDGSPLWGVDGVAACSFVSNQQYPDIVANGKGGAYVVWSDARTGNWDVYAQWVKADGALTWTTGLALCTATDNQWLPQACSDGRGGFIAAWPDRRNGSNNDLYASGIDSNQTYIMNDVAVCTADYDQSQVVLAPDGLGGAYFAWHDMRPQFSSDIYAQRISRNNFVEWAPDGIPVCLAAGSQDYLFMTEDGFGGAVLAWSDSRNGTGSDLYAHRLEPDGIGDWAADGVLLSDQSGTNSALAGGIEGDGLMGAIAVWHDNRSTDWDVYAQRVERAGNWGYPSASISSVADVPYDQGGQVTLTWDASRLDVIPDETVTHYSVWRSLDEKSLASGVKGVRLSEVTIDFTGPAILLGGGKSAGAWEWVANQPAHWLPEYAYTAATVNDSIAGNPGLHHFFVASHTSNQFLFWDSLPDSGYSVDNLAPAAPAALAGEADFDPVSLHLSWRPNQESDLAGYRVYRGTAADFAPGVGNLLTALADTAVTDSGWSNSSGFHYKVTALDIHGNESPWAYLAPAGVSGSEDPPVATQPFLANHPNPFNPQTKISYSLDQPAMVMLRIMDARGREVAVLREGRRPTGRHELNWNGTDSRGRSLASGIYFCRLEAGSLRLVQKMSLVR